LRIVSLKRMTIPKVAVLIMGLTAAVLVATINPPPAQARPSYGTTCSTSGCHIAGGSVTATPSSATPAPGAAYTVAIVLTNTATGNSGYNISLAGVSILTGGPAAGKTFTANMTAPAAIGVYTYNVAANTAYPGATSGTTFTIDVKAPPVVVTTTTALAVTPASPVVAPASPTLTATVTGAGAAGTVEFFNGTTSLGTPSAVSAGVASKTLTGVVAGSYSYTAVFTPTDAAAFTPSTSPVSTYVVTAASSAVTTSTALAVTPASPVVAPASPTLTATVTGAGAAGTVEFFNGTTSLGTPSAISAGVASTTLTGIAAGSYPYKAVFTPTDATAFTSSTSSVVTYVVNASVAVPTASFNASPITGIAPLAVTFTDTSIGAPTSWSWTFGNGSTSNVQNPSVVTYTTTGTYTVTLIASNTGGASAAVSKTITVTASVPAPTASFNASPISGVAPLAVTLTDTSIGAPTSWLWTFGNGSTSNVQNPPVVNYTTAGTYSVTLIVSNAGGASAAVSKTITVTPPPSISGLLPKHGLVGDTVTINGIGFGTAGVVTFGGAAVATRTWTDTAITFVVPAGSRRVQVTVTPTGAVASNTVMFRFEHVRVPRI
jgi:PKD repeat protein